MISSPRSILFFLSFFCISNLFSGSPTDQVQVISKDTVKKIDVAEKVLNKDAKKCALLFSSGDTEFNFSVKFKPEMFYGKNTYLLNNCNDTDTIFYFRHTVDFSSEYKYGKMSAGHEIIKFKMVWRNKAVWGDDLSIGSTTDTEIKVLDSSVGTHRHRIPRLFPWIREIWLQICLSDIAGHGSQLLQYFTIGAFPFQLGRGIALGDAYAVDPDTLGFFSPNAVDQYAFGGKFSGSFVKNRLFYDFYVAILDNKWSSFENDNFRSRAQQYGRRFDQARGTGVLNYIIAGRLLGYPIKNEFNSLSFEPYAMYNHNPENRIEFLGDASSDLVTLGFACEASANNGEFEFGFDTAYNLGRQNVFGWDRNIIKLGSDSAGYVQQLNTQVTDTTTNSLAPFTKSNQAIINNSIQSQCENDQFIKYRLPGGTPQVSANLKNSDSRFSDPYINTLHGNMFVFDMAYWFYKDRLKFAWTIGYASGDANPNRDEDVFGDSNIDGTYDGFVSLQELYSGVRVKSAFLLAGSGRIPRILNFSNPDEVIDPFPSKVSRFTNLIYSGFGSEIRSCPGACKPWGLKPNILVFLQDRQTKIFDRVNGVSAVSYASPFLGTEVNLFSDVELIKDLKAFAVIAVFIPGQHFSDVKGRPLSRDQEAYLNSLNNTGIQANKVPVLGDNTAFFINIGLDYKF